MTILHDPRLFNYFILTIYALAAIWWAAHGKPWDAAYWMAAWSITFVVTFGYAR